MLTLDILTLGLTWNFFNRISPLSFLRYISKSDLIGIEIKTLDFFLFISMLISLLIANKKSFHFFWSQIFW